jgi:hypothetical protein
VKTAANEIALSVHAAFAGQPSAAVISIDNGKRRA